MGNKHAKEGGGDGATRRFHTCYIVGRELGTGAFSVVKSAVNKATHEDVAVKIVNKKKLSEEDLQALSTEIQILDCLDHQHIIKLMEVFEEEGQFFIVTELVQGGELFDRIVAKSHYSEKEARDLIKIFLETMSYMHANNIVHRDLKPENLLLVSDTSDSDVKIADFGFAKRVSDLLPHETACGTPGYVAPEVLRGDPYGTEVDIWSMGVICYVLLVGYPPFYDDDQKKLFKKIKEARYYFHEDYWSKVSPDAIDLIKRMLTLKQADRWTANQLLQHKWIRAGDEELANKSLAGALVELKRFNAKRRFKSAADAVIMTNRMKNLMLGNIQGGDVSQSIIITKEMLEDPVEEGKAEGKGESKGNLAGGSKRDMGSK